jgi:two-component sensor histidine kinase/CheY-like chemotaxis protein
MTDAPLRLLYIDDDPGLARLVQKSLERRGFVVETVSDGAAGLERVRAQSYDAVALDHYMPGRDGLAVLAEINALPHPPPVVYVTGTQESAIAVAALKAGAADYVVKSIGGEFTQLLEAAITQAIQAVRLRRAKEQAEQEVRAARDRFEALAAERALLMREVNHRVGNSLQIIAALLHLQSSSAGSSDVKSALAAANRRVMAVAQVHRRLYTSDDVGAVALDQYLGALVEDLRGSAEGDGGGDELTLEAEPCPVDPDRAVAVGIVVTELVLNALKYAYPGGKGPIRVTLRNGPEGRAHLAVEDDGSASASGGSDLSVEGLGGKIVRAMAMKLGAEWGRDEAHSGMRITLAFDRTSHKQHQTAA